VLYCNLMYLQTSGGDVAGVEKVLAIVESTLNVLANSVLQEQPPLRRRKMEHLVMYKFKFGIKLNVNRH
jgi:dynein heavy chain 1